MSTFRNRAMNYDSARKTKFGSTSSQFGKVGRNVDSESEKPKLVNEQFVERPKADQTEQPSTSKEIRGELEKLTNDEDKPVDKSNFSSRDPHPTVRKAPVSTEDELITNHKAGGAFMKVWTTVDHIVIPQVIESKKSSYTPNYIAANAILMGMERCLDSNEELKWICPNYFSLPVRIYYAVVYYLQIMKAKEAAGKLLRSEGSWFRSFKRVFPLESLPIAGPLVPYFSNLVSVLPNDDKYDFIYPEFDPTGGLTLNKGIPITDPRYFLQPNVALLSSLMKLFCSKSSQALFTPDEDDEYDHFSDNGSLIPKTFDDEPFTFCGVDFPKSLNTACSSVLCNIAMDTELPETIEKLKSTHQYWRKSRCVDIPDVDKDCTFDTLGETLRMKDDFEWFEDCVSMATIQCKFFTESANLSQIPSVGGTEALITAHIMTKDRNLKAAKQWYPQNLKSIEATFQTTRADATPGQFYNSMYALSNATISWTTQGQPIGGYQAGHRTGPYWRNKEFTFQSNEAVPVGTRISTMIQSHFYDYKGEAS